MCMGNIYKLGLNNVIDLKNPLHTFRLWSRIQAVK